MPVIRFLQWLVLALAAALALAAVPAGAQTVAPPIPAGTNPRAVAVDPVLNKVYIVSELTNQVIALDGATNATTPIPTGNRPQFIAVNPTNHRVYVTNANDATMTEIDGTTNTVVNTLGVGGNGPIAINPITNRIFMVRLSSPATDEVTIIDGNTDTWFSIALDSFQPDAIALNPVTNLVYVATFATGDVRIVDGNTNVDFPHPPAVGVFSQPVALAVNPVTDRTYVVTNDSRGPFGYIDGSNNYTFFTAPGHAASPKAVAVNVVTNKIYAAFDGEVMVMDGATNAFTFIPSGAAGAGPVAIGINPTTNKIYVPNANGTLTVIDGATNATTTLTIPSGATSIGVNPLTNAMYVTAPDSVSVVSGAATDTPQSIPLTTSITPLPGDASDPNPTITLNASSGFSPVAPAVWRVYYQLDGTSGPWTAASGNGPYTASFTGLSAGSHTLHAFATDTQEGPTVNTGPQSVPLVGSVSSYTFTVSTSARATPSTSLTSSQQPTSPGQPDAITFKLIVSGNSGTPTGTASFAADGTTISGCSAVALSAGQATCTTSSLATGQHAIAASYSGDATYNPASASLTSTVSEDPTIAISSSANPSVAGDTVTFTATVGGSAGPATGTASFRADGGIISGCDVILSNGTATCSTSSLTVGTHAITLRYEGDANYNIRNSSPFSQTVNNTAGKTNPSIALASNRNPSIPGQSVTLTATVSGGAGTPTGNVTFFDGTTQLCIASLASGSAQCSATFAKGTHNLTASYSGDAAYNPATSAVLFQTVGSLANSSFTSSVNPSNQGQAVTFTLTLTGANGTPTGTANFTSDSTGIPGCGSVALSNGVASCTTSALAPGQHNVEVVYSGDAMYVGFQSSPIVQTVNGTAATPTVTLASSANPSSFGNAVTLTATVSGSAGTATGSVVFKEGNAPIYGCDAVALSSGSAACTTSDLAPGSHSITAQYSGDSAYAAATSTALAQTVQGAPPSQPAAWKVRTLDPPQHVLGLFTNVADIGPRSALDAAGNLYVAFSTFDSGTSTSCIVVVKYTAGNGAVAWQFSSCDAGSTTFAAALALDSAGNVLVSGMHFQSGYLAKLSGATGTALWTQILAPHTTGIVGLSVGVAANGDVRMAGWENGEITIYGFAGSDGSLQWLRQLTNSIGSAKVVAFTVDPSGGSAVTEFDSDGNNNAQSVVSRLDNFGSFVWRVTAAGDHLAIDSAGNVIATVTNGVTKLDAATGAAAWTVFVPARAVALDAQDNVYVTGTFGSAPDTDIATSKISAGGQVLWSHAYIDPTISGDSISIALDGSGNAVVGGFGRGTATGNATQAVTLEYAGADGRVLWKATDQDSLGGSFPYAVNANGTNASNVGSIFNQTTGALGGIYAISYGQGGGTTKLDATVALASSANPSSPGESVTFTATVSGSGAAPTGAVTFFDGANVLCSATTLSGGSAACTTSGLAQGTHSITAHYGGDGTYNPGDSAPLGQTVSAASLATASVSLASSANPSNADSSVTFTANVTGSSGTPTGSVTFSDGGTAICSAVALSSGSATCATASLAQGTHSITASYSGDGTYASASSAPLSQVVQSASTPVNVALASAGAVATASSTYSSTYGPANAINGDRSGAFSEGGIWLDGTRSAFPDWFQVRFAAAQTIDHVVVYSMQDNYGSPVDPSDTMTFTKYGVVDFQVQVWNGSSWITAATVTGNNLVKRTVPFTAVSTDRIRILITHALGGSSRLAEVEAFTPGSGGGGSTPATASVALSSSANPSTFGNAVTFTATVTGGSGMATGTVTFADGGSAICTAVALSSGTATCGTSSLAQGTHAITASYSGDSTYGAATSSALSQQVNGATTGGTGSNVALASAGAVATASSTFSSTYAPANAINGDRTGGSMSGGLWLDATRSAFPDWLQVRFAGTQSIDRVVVYSMQDNYGSPVDPSDTMTFSKYGVVDFQVQAWNGTSWVTLATVMSNDLVKRTVTFAPVSTDRIRVLITRALAGSSRLAEVEAWTN